MVMACQVLRAYWVGLGSLLIPDRSLVCDTKVVDNVWGKGMSFCSVVGAEALPLL